MDWNVLRIRLDDGPSAWIIFVLYRRIPAPLSCGWIHCIYCCIWIADCHPQCETRSSQTSVWQESVISRHHQVCVNFAPLFGPACLLFWIWNDNIYAWATSHRSWSINNWCWTHLPDIWRLLHGEFSSVWHPLWSCAISNTDLYHWKFAVVTGVYFYWTFAGTSNGTDLEKHHCCLCFCSSRIWKHYGLNFRTGANYRPTKRISKRHRYLHYDFRFLKLSFMINSVITFNIQRYVDQFFVPGKFPWTDDCWIFSWCLWLQGFQHGFLCWICHCSDGGFCRFGLQCQIEQPCKVVWIWTTPLTERNIFDNTEIELTKPLCKRCTCSLENELGSNFWQDISWISL